MIAHLKGKFFERFQDDLILDVGGVGYLLSVTSSVISNLPEPDGEMNVIVYTEVREAGIFLYGFSTLLEKEVFLLLRKVSGIGSKTALALISGAGVEGLLRAIGSGDSVALTRVNGVGKKTAERVLIELREQVSSLIPIDAGIFENSNTSFRPPKKSIVGDTILALEKLGFTSDKARTAVSSALEIEPGIEPVDAGLLLRNALSQLDS